MEIKTDFIDTYTNEIDKLLRHCNKMKHNIRYYSSYIAFNFWVCRFIFYSILRLIFLKQILESLFLLSEVNCLTP
jgi:hypothetical protein